MVSKRRRRFSAAGRFIGLVASLAGLLLGLLLASPPASVAQTSPQTSFRISRLESEIRMLQSRINQLESQIERGDRPSRPASPTSESAPDSPPLSMAAGDPMFDQLATLVIETRQDVFALEERLSALEQELAD